jgi:hypothetical protein
MPLVNLCPKSLASNPVNNSEPVTPRLIGLTDPAYAIISEQSAANGMTGAEWVEWVVLCQQFPPGEASSLWNQRRRRGGRGGVVVVDDEFELPPEG